MIANVLAPHYCCSCGSVGSVLCEYCKFDIISQPYERCVACLGLALSNDALCRRCDVPYRHAWVAGERSGVLEYLIDDYKFKRARSVATTLVDLLDEAIPPLPSDLLVVPVPTISRHIRQRGYDHAATIARMLAKRRKLLYRAVLYRKTQTVQRDASRAGRERQASVAFASQPLSGERCLLVDDIYTTGATIRHATNVLIAAGASEVWVALIARQPLEK